MPTLTRLKDPVEQYKAKFATMRMFKFDPLVMHVSIVGWPLKSDNNYRFFWQNKPEATHNEVNPQILEHAIVEVGSEREAFAMKKFLY